MSDVFIDPRDGEAYRIVEISGQIWMAENLRYRVSVKKIDNWTIEEKEFYYPPNGQRKNISEYGCLYTWANALKAVPEGWHLPSKEEFETFLINVGCHDKDSSRASINLRATNFKNGSDTYGFGALPAGLFYAGYRHLFVGDCAFFWSSTEGNCDSDSAYNLRLSDNNVNVDNYSKILAFSVRCIKD